MCANTKPSSWQAMHTVAIGEVTRFVLFATVVAAAVGAPLASTAKPAPKSTPRGTSVAGGTASFRGAAGNVPEATNLNWRLFGNGMTEPGALKSKVPGKWQVSQSCRMPGYPMLLNESKIEPSGLRTACQLYGVVRLAAA